MKPYIVVGLFLVAAVTVLVSMVIVCNRPSKPASSYNEIKAEPVGMVVAMPGTYPNEWMLMLDTNVFAYDTNRRVVTLRR